MVPFSSPNPPRRRSLRFRRRERRLLEEEFAQRPDARRLSFVGSAQKVIAERRSYAGREWRDKAAGGESSAAMANEVSATPCPWAAARDRIGDPNISLPLIRKTCYSYQFAEGPTVQCLTGRAGRGGIFLFGFRHNPLKSPDSDE
jgi:hypothetical protein